MIPSPRRTALRPDRLWLARLRNGLRQPTSCAGQDAELVTVLRHRPAREHEPEPAQVGGELGVGLRMLLGREQLDQRILRRTRPIEETGERDDPPGRKQHIAPGDGAAHGRLVNPQRVCHLGSRQRYEVASASADELVLPRHHHFRDPGHRPPPLLEPIDELARRRQLASDRLALFVRELRGRGPLIRRADDQPEAVPLDQLDREPALGLADRDVRHERRDRGRGHQVEAGMGPAAGPG